MKIFERPLISLKVLYDGMPQTNGCNKCSEINGEENKDWCCKKLNPSLYYVEFSYVIQHVWQHWSNAKRTELLLRSVRNYLDNSLSKGCVFYINGCSIYERRPLQCRLYSVIPESSWNKRCKSIKERYGDDFEIIPQCNLVTSERPITENLENKWFQYTKKCEEDLGIPKRMINLHDNDGGSYRTFHDHLLLEFLGEEVMVELTKVRLNNPTTQEIDQTIKSMRDSIEEAIYDEQAIFS